MQHILCFFWFFTAGQSPPDISSDLRSCPFSPRFSRSAKDMTVLPANLRHPLNFPIFASCPASDSLDPSYFQTLDEGVSLPLRHWCLLAEIVSKEGFLRLRLQVKDGAGYQFPIDFHLEDHSPAPWDCQLGNTIAILYACQHRFPDRSVAIRQEMVDTFKVGVVRIFLQLLSPLTSLDCSLPIDRNSCFERQSASSSNPSERWARHVQMSWLWEERQYRP